MHQISLGVLLTAGSVTLPTGTVNLEPEMSVEIGEHLLRTRVLCQCLIRLGKR